MTDNMRGKPPFGYTVTGPPTERRLIPDAAQQAVVQRMHTLSADGNTRQQIAATLNAEGVPAPRRWSPTAVGLVLKRVPQIFQRGIDGQSKEDISAWLESRRTP